MKSNYLNYILDQLQDLDGITIQKQMGGVRFFRYGQVFGAISGGRFRLRKASCGEPGPESDSSAFSPQNLVEKKGLNPSNWCAVPEAVVADSKLFTQIIRYASGEELGRICSGQMSACG